MPRNSRQETGRQAFLLFSQDRGAKRVAEQSKGRIIMYRRIGILSYSSPGHYYPLTALARRLQSRGHDVLYFQVADLEKPIRAAGLRFCQIGRDDFPLGSLRMRDEECGALEGRAALRCGIRGIVRKSQML